MLYGRKSDMKRILRNVGIAVLGIVLAVCGYYAFTVWQARKATLAIFERLKTDRQLRLTLVDFPDGWLEDLLKIEDPNFYGHNGVDLSTPGAGITTITQGMVKYLYFENFKPGVAKLRQSLIAVFAVNALISK